MVRFQDGRCKAFKMEARYLAGGVTSSVRVIPQHHVAVSEIHPTRCQLATVSLLLARDAGNVDVYGASYLGYVLWRLGKAVKSGTTTHRTECCWGHRRSKYSGKHTPFTSRVQIDEPATVLSICGSRCGTTSSTATSRSALFQSCG